ncbi:MAG: oligosaccharide flippase family protein [Bacteroidetes bacterium]|nr:oligosaccharide flippase family protein [Bacteroidota bacterium]
MKQPQAASTRVVINTGILYAKMLITMGISLYSTRLVLNALGASDYGIFNLIAGVIAMLSFLNVAMTVSTQRYLSFHQGTGDCAMQKKIFTNSWVLHIAIGVVVVVALLVLAPVLFGGFLNIPADRIPTAQTIYYFMSVSVFFTIISVPFTASLNAHENMLWIAIVNIIESIVKLAIALSLVWFIQAERLVMYGLFMAVLSAISFLLYAVYSLKKYDECSVRNYQIDKPFLKEIGSFAGWNLFGTLCGAGKIQGLAIVLNLFFGTVINAAFGIANQVSAQVIFFSQTMLRAINPQIMISEGRNDRQRMLRLSLMASKFGFFLLAFVAIPIIFEMPVILQLWLKNVPEHTVVFCSLVLVAMLVNQLTIGSFSALQATGKIKAYQSITGSVLLLTVPLAYILLKLGFPAYYAVVSLITMEIIATAFKLYFWKHKAGLSIRNYFERVIFKAAIPLITVVAVCWLITQYLNFEFRFLLTGFISVLFFALSIYFTGLCKDEKQLIHDMVVKKVLKKLHKSTP